MADEGNQGQNRRMDLNLYLGLPRSPRRTELDLGSDLALGSLAIQGESDNRVSAEMPGGYAESHAPYSPSHASYSPNPQPAQHLGLDENLPFEYSDHSPPPSYPSVSQSMQPQGRSHLEYNPYTPSYDPASPTEQAGLEPPDQDAIDPIDHAPYLPVYVPLLSTEQDISETMVLEDSNHLQYVPYSPTYVPASLSPPAEPNEPLVQEENLHVPYIPVTPTATQVNNDHSSGTLPEVTGFSPYQPTAQVGGASVRDGSVEQERLRYSEGRSRRLIESNRRWPVRRFRSTIPHRFGPDWGVFSSGNLTFRSVTPSERSIEADNGSQKTTLEGLAAQDLEEGKKEQSSRAANFDCNICLDVASESVVTSCGHLFCWPCLYQWLHLHSDHKECPVCKGEVIESNITPIYGRGCSEMGVEKKGREAGDSGLKVPPRPRGHRYESLRQRMCRPLSRRLTEETGSWRLILGQETHNGNRVDGQEEPSVQGIFDGANHRMLARFMAAQRLQRADHLENVLNLWGSGSSRNATEMDLNHTEDGNLPPVGLHGGGPVSTPPALGRLGVDLWPRHVYSVPSSDRLAAIAANLSNMVGNMANSGNHSGASTSVNPQDSNSLNVQGPLEAVVAADQASASSTMAVIQGDTGLDAPVEPNSVGSSHSPRRRRRNGVSGSLDVDGGVHHAHKRRRLN